ncbi:MAG: 3-isopropylmalate dehydrogenase [Candidatus Hecatellales archaeon]|nr:MAG: 3-isopropylmalate dehydrogenase [Candidatus Hecatellales archaeon]
MKAYRVALIRGDGIGPEQVEATLPVLQSIMEGLNVNLEILEVEAGDECMARRGVPLPEETIETIKASHVCLKGPVGETAADVIVRLRLMFDLYVNLRPAKAYPRVPCLRPDIDMVIVRENTEDLYKGFEYTTPDGEVAVALRVISRRASRRIAEYAFKLARARKRKVVAVHKANVMKATCGLFAEECRRVAEAYPDVAFREMYVDAAAMNLIKRPHEFDVIVIPNMFGDILSDEAAQLVGGLGMAPGANIGDSFALFEPIHGSAPHLAGQQKANPLSMILSAGLMFRWLGERWGDGRCLQASQLIEEAVTETLREGVVTQDLGGTFKTMDVGRAVAEKVLKLAEEGG